MLAFFFSFYSFASLLVLYLNRFTTFILAIKHVFFYFFWSLFLFYSSEDLFIVISPEAMQCTTNDMR